MKRLLAVAILLLCGVAQGAIWPNTFTTNSNQIFSTTTSSLYPLMIDSATGTVGTNGVQFSPSFWMTGTNGTILGSFSLSGRTNKLSIVNDQLYLDGVAISGGTAAAPINNLYVTNLFVQNGNHNTMVVSNSLSIQPVKTNLLATTSTGLVTNANYGSGISWDPTTRTISASSSGDTTGTNIVTLTQSGTNLAAEMDFSLVQMGGAFKLVLSNNVHIGVPANVSSTVFRKAFFFAQQPSTGTCYIDWTNTVFCASEGATPINDTNAGSVSIYELVSDPFTSGLVHISMTALSRKMTNSIP